MVEATKAIDTTSGAADNELIQHLGDKLRHGQNAGTEVLTGQAVGESNFVGVYFGAHWAPPCRKFTTSLKKNYQEANEKGKQLEVIFCSSDGNEDAFVRNYNDMEWFAIDFNDQARKQSLSQLYGIMELPTLVILDRNGRVISLTGDKDLKEGTEKALENWEKSRAELDKS